MKTASREAKQAAAEMLGLLLGGEDGHTKALFPKGTRVYGGGDYSKVFCTTTGHYQRCRLSGCGALSIRAVWAPGTVGNKKPRVVWLCEKGLSGGGGPRKKNWRIG